MEFQPESKAVVKYRYLKSEFERGSDQRIGFVMFVFTGFTHRLLRHCTKYISTLECLRYWWQQIVTAVSLDVVAVTPLVRHGLTASVGLVDTATGCQYTGTVR